MITTLVLICRNSNEAIFEQLIRSPADDVARFDHSFLLDYLAAQCPNIGVGFSNSQVRSGCRGCWFGYGYPECDGQFIGGFARKLQFMVDVDLLEALAALHAVCFAFDIGLREIILEGDSLRKVNGICSSDEDLSTTDLVRADVKATLGFFLYNSCIFVKRDRC
uniref:Putative Reverse transcriptase-like n=1 Tax=Davidia involucrata TaxID=16924 RepID=A0A5B6YYW4_DAVIN